MRVLTFDIEDWFHILDFDDTVSITSWDKYEVRLDAGIDFILEALANKGFRATFFILGWVAEKHPHAIKKIISMGHELGNHSYSHLLLYRHKPDEVIKDLKYSNNILQDLSGRSIKYFRAPGFSIKKDTNWVFDVLCDLGIEVDSSIFPTSRGHGGYRGFPFSTPCIINYKGRYLKELPVNTYNFMGKEIVFSGGGYFRLLPFYLQKLFYRNSNYLMTYFHTRDFDSDQPVLRNLSILRKFKSYVGLKGSKAKFLKLLEEYEYIDINEACKKINWGKAPIVNITDEVF